ncbi:MerR family transcriptional regulator [Rhodococcus yananensis]|uniref:MerR family transcriptional regulator n=1 Tax=Rhodococcus yananensis TaxID=2879464 RepID=UPI001CF87B54|nr:MerR family transcriptional regulator [Rhodococcus yananensis]
MRISELAARAGVPLPTVKYYLREGLLMPGRATSATQARYDDTHVRRLGLVRALAGQGLPLDRIKVVVALVEQPGDDLFAALGKAVAALPPYVDDPPDADHPRARALLERIGQSYDPRFAAVAQLERALVALESAGLTMSGRRIDVYDRHIRAIADLEVDMLPMNSRHETVEAAVLGTALYEPVLAAMRRLAHQHRAARAFAASPDRHPQNAGDTTTQETEAP